MEKSELIRIRKKLEKTQKELAAILGISLQAVRSYEQGTRTIPGHVERQVIFILCQKDDTLSSARSCWDVKKCPPEQREHCPAWEFNCGTLCWFINGTICECSAKENWQDKMTVCRNCEVLATILNNE
ncbi:MAG: helix-turn-helix transcriptional regulator [Desulfobulbaceae bacterium]|nr:helix-turn-helix transcriptional regulator [Desulfobulbaceae bacterium]